MRHLCGVWIVPVLILSQVAWGETLNGKVVGLSEGDTLSILIGESDIRTVCLSGVDCPDKGQEFYQESKTAASDLCLGKQVSIEITGINDQGKTLGVVTLEEGLNLNQELLRRGWAFHYTRYGQDPTLAELESQARTAHLGLWAQAEPVAPWTFRKEDPVSSPTPAPEKKSRNAKKQPEWWMYAAPSDNFPETARYGTHLSPYQPTPEQRQKAMEAQAAVIKSEYGMGPVAHQLREEIELNKAAEESAFLYGEYDPYTQTYRPGQDSVTLDRRTGIYHDNNSPWAHMLYEEDKIGLPRKEALRRGAYPSPWDYNYYNYWGW